MQYSSDPSDAAVVAPVSAWPFEPLPPAAPPSLFERLFRPALGANTAILLVALYLATTQNLTLAKGVLHSLAGVPGWTLAGTVLLLLMTIEILLLSIFGISRALKPAMIALLLLASVCSYFMDNFGVVISESMIANAFETDVREAADLLQWRFLLHVALQGLLPALLVYRSRIVTGNPAGEVARRLALVGGSLLLTLGCVGAQYKDSAMWGRENREVRLYNNPGYPLYSAYRHLRSGVDKGPAAAPLVIAPDAARAAVAGARPLLVVLVVGETARAANFQLNGYARATNPHLAAVDGLINYSRVHSCGTATAESLPCMFSNLGRGDFSKKKAAAQENLLDILQRVGVQVAWRDNNGDCKGVCARVDTEQIAADRGSNLCVSGACYDEVLAEDLDRHVPQPGEAGLLVLHQMGSHGPAYYKRYPKTHRRFLPDCVDNNVQLCTREEITNAYDNTIAYTDFVLGRLIEQLQERQDRMDSVLIYVSDHGESLGEHGIYLHGLPYAIAPDEQKQVPMLAWFSARAPAALGIDLACARTASAQPYSHDNLFHSMLGLFGVGTRAYSRGDDLFGHCRHRS